MYQALYRKWRPRTFDDVVGQSHITDTLKQQVAGDRLSHAYLFTGTRGTGKTTCAKILARAVNCQNPQNGNPCNACPACLGIENGSILDVLELDAASNNGVDQVRALRDEAVYTPAAVRKRVYIVDEVHMLSTPAFNALLKILEEPPAHLMFILATTELHKVPATIKSRCQQFSFKRILPGQIAQRLSYVAGEEHIDLTPQGAALLARLADGGLRDALSLLDQCSGGGQHVDEQEILDTLGLAGNLETARLMELITEHDTAAALEKLGQLYANGKDVGAVLGELSSLIRDLLLRKTAPKGGAALLTGGYDEGTMRTLGEQCSAARLLQMLTLVQETLGLLPRSSNSRTDAELCLLRLCDERLDDSLAGLSARVAQLEERLASGVPVQPPAPAKPTPASVPQQPKQTAAPAEDAPPWEEERPPLPEEPALEREPQSPEELQPPAPLQSAPAPQSAPAASNLVSGGEDRDFWPSFAAGLRGKISPSLMPYFTNPARVIGIWRPGVLTLWVDSDFTRNMLHKPAVVDVLVQAAQARFAGPARVEFKVGQPPTQAAAPTQAPDAGDALDQLLAFGEQFDNIVIK
jgi:DNA polymerase-3 subunit gamma/tau